MQQTCKLKSKNWKKCLIGSSTEVNLIKICFLRFVIFTFFSILSLAVTGQMHFIFMLPTLQLSGVNQKMKKSKFVWIASWMDF
jgi:hypothetical protein